MSFLQAENTNTLIWRNSSPDVVVKDAREAMFRHIVTYASDGGDITSVTPDGGNTGTGAFDNLHSGPGAPPETWTITMDSATTFTVSGGTSGAQAAGTVDVAYVSNGTTESALLQFTLDSNANNGDIWTIVVAAFSPAVTSDAIWILDRWDPNGDLEDSADALIWHGEGAGGTEAIHAGMKMVTNSGSSIYSFTLRNYTGFTGGGDWDTQPGQSKAVFCPFDNNDFEFWFVVSGRRYVLVGKPTGSVDVMLYQGFIDAYGSPAEYPFPSFVCGSSDLNLAATDSSADFHTFIVNANQGQLRDTAGLWLDFDQDGSIGHCRGWPNTNGLGNPETIWDNVQNLGTDDQLFPAIITQGPTIAGEPLTSQVFGELDGVAVVNGFNLNSGDVLTVGADTWVVFADCFRTSREFFFAVKME